MGRHGRYYSEDLAWVHHRGFAFHADGCAPEILRLLGPIRGGTVLELGCGSGHLTRHLVTAGHEVIATDGSADMLALARDAAPGAEVRELLLPDDPLPSVDAVVSVGHVLNYLPDRPALERALVAAAGALRPGGLLVLDLCDLRYGALRGQQANLGMADDDWAIVTRYSLPEPDRFVRDITTFVREDDGRWRRDDERHENVLIDTSTVPALLSQHGVLAELEPRLGSFELPQGLVAVVGRKEG